MENFEIIKFTDKDLSLDVSVSPSEETVWLTKEQMSILFDRDRTVISRHIKNIFDEREVEEKSNVHFLHVANSDKPVSFYSLDVIISVGYRVKSKNGVIFRKWASNVLKNYLLNGYAISRDRIFALSENYINLVNDVNNLKNDVSDIKKIVNEDFPKETRCYEDKVFDAYIFLNDLFKSAKESITVIDGYLDDTIFRYLAGISKDVQVALACSKPQRLSDFELELFKKQNDEIKIYETKSFHDRFICIDDDVNHLGSSFNSFATKTTSIIKMSCVTKEELLNKII